MMSGWLGFPVARAAASAVCNDWLVSVSLNPGE